MNNTIEILDKDTNTKQTYVLKEKPEKKEIDLTIVIGITKIIIKSIMKLFRFNMYLAISFLELVIKLLKALFRLNDYNPLGFISEAREKRLDKRAAKNINRERIRFATEKLTKHTYEFERSDLYSSTYKYIADKLKDFADNNVAINQDIYRDILAKIDVLTVEVERKALQEGYDYAAFTKYRFSDEVEEVYDNFIEYKIMRGEGRGKVGKEQRESGD